VVLDIAFRGVLWNSLAASVGVRTFLCFES